MWIVQCNLAMYNTLGVSHFLVWLSHSVISVWDVRRDRRISWALTVFPVRCELYLKKELRIGHTIQHSTTRWQYVSVSTYVGSWCNRKLKEWTDFARYRVEGAGRKAMIGCKAVAEILKCLPAILCKLLNVRLLQYRVWFPASDAR
jgi:hypothetical protein